MFLGLLRAGLFAGILTAVVYSFVQALTVTPLIFEAEFFEGQADRLYMELQRHGLEIEDGNHFMARRICSSVSR